MESTPFRQSTATQEGGNLPNISEECKQQDDDDALANDRISNKDSDNYNDTGTTSLHHMEEKIKPHRREPFLACFPQVGKWGYSIVTNEINIAKKAVLGFPSWISIFLWDTYQYYHTNPNILYSEILSGFTVAIMQVPESIAFSFVAGVPPLSGLQATFWMALITGILGGKPGMISGKILDAFPKKRYGESVDDQHASLHLQMFLLVCRFHTSIPCLLQAPPEHWLW